MLKWTVYLIGDRADLEALAGLDGGVMREGANFVFRSADLDVLTDAAVVEEAVSQRIEILKGLVRVITGDQRVRTVTGRTMHREEDGKSAFIGLLGLLEEELQRGVPGDPSEWVAATLRDREKVGWALQLFAGEPTAATLYKVFEVIQSDLGGEMVRRHWTTEKATTRFTSTIDSVHLLCVQARHGVQKGNPMAEKAMTVREMRDFIRGLMVKWLDSK